MSRETRSIVTAYAMCLVFVAILSIYGMYSFRVTISSYIDKRGEHSLVSQSLYNSRIGVCIVDRKGIVKEWSPMMEFLTGWSALDMIGKPITKILPEDHPTLPNLSLDTYYRPSSSDPNHFRTTVFISQKMYPNRRKVKVGVTASIFKADDGEYYVLGLVYSSDRIMDLFSLNSSSSTK